MLAAECNATRSLAHPTRSLTHSKQGLSICYRVTPRAPCAAARGCVQPLLKGWPETWTGCAPGEAAPAARWQPPAARPLCPPTPAAAAPAAPTCRLAAGCRPLPLSLERLRRRAWLAPPAAPPQSRPAPPLLQTARRTAPTWGRRPAAAAGAGGAASSAARCGGSGRNTVGASSALELGRAVQQAAELRLESACTTRQPTTCKQAGKQAGEAPECRAVKRPGSAAHRYRRLASTAQSVRRMAAQPCCRLVWVRESAMMRTRRPRRLSTWRVGREWVSVWRGGANEGVRR